MSRLIYLDHAAATPMDPRVLEAMLPYFEDKFFNPSADYAEAQNVRRDLETARHKIAQVLGAKPSEIIFTAGATEANNLAIKGVMDQFPGSNLVVSAIEHPSIIEPASHYQLRKVKVDKKARLDLNDLDKQINHQTVLVSVMQANHEVGTTQPIKEVAKLIQTKLNKRKTNLPLYFHTDSAQAANYLDLHVARLGVDLLTLNGGKIYGPKQSGALYIKAGVKLKPLIDGGGQERGLRSGTENVASAIGLATALELVQTMRHSETKRLSDLQHYFMRELKQQIPEVVVNGSVKFRLPNNVHITLPGKDNERLLLELEAKGILAAAGSACSASNDEPSSVLKAMDLDNQAAHSSLRFSLGKSTTKQDLDKVIKVITSLV